MSFQCCCSNINNQCRKIDINTTLIKLTLDTSHSTLQYLSNILSMFCAVWNHNYNKRLIMEMIHIKEQKTELTEKKY